MSNTHDVEKCIMQTYQSGFIRGWDLSKQEFINQSNVADNGSNDDDDYEPRLTKKQTC